MNCAHCGQKPTNRCNSEGFDCCGGKLDLCDYEQQQNQKMHHTSDCIRQEYGDSLSRLEEIIHFARRLEYKKIGLAFCIGLADEAFLVADILKKHFSVESACCKISGMDKEKYKMPRIHTDKLEVACNPLGQAQVFNQAETQLNIQMGLCLGHDILFQQYSHAPVTVLVVKDRVLANNPMGVVYGSYWRKRL